MYQISGVLQSKQHLFLQEKSNGTIIKVIATTEMISATEAEAEAGVAVGLKIVSREIIRRENQIILINLITVSGQIQPKSKPNKTNWEFQLK
jgi:hypothetical protein